MKIIRTLKALRKWRSPIRTSIGFVPTMGALHKGHLSLIERAKKDNKICVVSIFVNPTQFGPKDDFKKYPRPWKNDVTLLNSLGVDVLFAPLPQQMYSASPLTQISVNQLNSVLCGDIRFRGPGHFNGVALVVAKLFNLVQPTRAYFGLKDFQQVRVIEQMVQDLNFDVQIIRMPTVRESNGLALSSRNTYLNPTEKSLSAHLHLALQRGRKLLTSSPSMKPQLVCSVLKKYLKNIPNSKIDYVECVNPVTLEKSTSSRPPYLLALAVRIGTTRLIDNLLI